MSRDRATLIAELSAAAAPVARARSGALRGAAWLVVTALAAALFVVPLYQPGTLAIRLAQEVARVELAATLLTGIAAIVAAFRLGTPGKPVRRPWLLPALLLLWVAATAASLGIASEPGSIRDSMACFRFVLTAGAPMAVAVIVALRRTRSLRPWRMAALAGLGVASLAAFLLAFCHPFALNPADVAMHVSAMALIVAVVTLLGGPALAIRTTRRA